MSLAIHMQLIRSSNGLFSSGLPEVLIYPYRKINNPSNKCFHNTEEFLSISSLFNDMGMRVRNILDKEGILFCPSSSVAIRDGFPEDVQVHYLSLSSDPKINDVIMKILFFKAPYNTNKPFFDDTSSNEWKTMLDRGSPLNHKLMDSLLYFKLISLAGYHSIVNSFPSLQLLAFKNLNPKQIDPAFVQKQCNELGISILEN